MEFFLYYISFFFLVEAYRFRALFGLYLFIISLCILLFSFLYSTFVHSRKIKNINNHIFFLFSQLNIIIVFVSQVIYLTLGHSSLICFIRIFCNFIHLTFYFLFFSKNKYFWQIKNRSKGIIIIVKLKIVIILIQLLYFKLKFSDV